ncbi:PREDICTED: uncharacterized protein LOC107191807 [Dufourea novaeangliae]|uniref:uncharacterized protein LOC107191807 n=1 Tax=Dufourea novaeangliae TaxID=178035 RepID=UPI000767C8D7|nr:PREDICTED: uncharacterized protein LOC107191807 [Dufourea novaeangliae]
MKSTLVAVFLLFAAFASADHADLYLEPMKDQILTCGKENGFTEQTPREIFDKDAAMGLDKATCHRACTMKLLNILKDSKIDADKLNNVIKMVHADQPEVVQKLQKSGAECIEKVKPVSDECKMAYAFVDCFLDKH